MKSPNNNDPKSENNNFSYFSDQNPYNIWHNNDINQNNVLNNQNTDYYPPTNRPMSDCNYLNRNNNLVSDFNHPQFNYHNLNYYNNPNYRFNPNQFNLNHTNQHLLNSNQNRNNFINYPYNNNCIISGFIPIENGLVNPNVRDNVMYNNPHHKKNYNNNYIKNNYNNMKDKTPYNNHQNNQNFNNKKNNVKYKNINNKKSHYDENKKTDNKMNPNLISNDIKPQIIMTIKKSNIVDPNNMIDNKSKNNLEENEEKVNKLNFKIDKTRKIDIIDNKIENIFDIIELGKLYNHENFKDKNYSINIPGLNNMIIPLEELNNLIGMDNIKKQIIDQIIFFSQDLHEQSSFKFLKNSTKKQEQDDSGQSEGQSLAEFFKKFMSDNDSSNEQLNSESYENNDIFEENQDMLHTIIEGPPGVGKTALGKILAKIYLSLGITKNNKFRIVKRKDLIGEYLGHTAIKTQKVIDSCLGGVLFIDEAYSLGNGDSKKDSYSKECIDTLNQNLSENKGKFVCIVAGYENELENDFFSVNPGLKRRFSFKYTINKYNYLELSNILLHKINKINWKIDDSTKRWLIEEKFLENKMEKFPHFGGDIESWLLNIKIEHAKRVFGQSFENHKILNKDDLKNGYKKFLENRNTKESKIIMNMYN